MNDIMIVSAHTDSCRLIPPNSVISRFDMIGIIDGVNHHVHDFQKVISHHDIASCRSGTHTDSSEQ